MKKFMDQDFLLSTETARKLYHEYAERMPVLDYHCHINPKEIYEDRKFDNIAQVWLNGDHYKWRQMRSNGGLKRWNLPSAIRSITGVIWNCSAILATTAI